MDCYAILGVDRSASKEDVIEAFDRKSQEPRDFEGQLEISMARTILVDDTQRHAYDLSYDLAVRHEPAPPTGSSAQYQQTIRHEHYHHNQHSGRPASQFDLTGLFVSIIIPIVVVFGLFMFAAMTRM